MPFMQSGTLRQGRGSSFGFSISLKDTSACGAEDQTNSPCFTSATTPPPGCPRPQMLAVELWSPAKLAALNWFLLTGEADWLVSSSSSVLIAFFILREHECSSPSEHVSGCMPPSMPELMPSSSVVSYKLLSLVKGNWNDSLWSVRAFRVCFLLVFFGFTANKMMTNERCSHLHNWNSTKFDLSSLLFTKNVKTMSSEHVCCNISCVKTKVSSHKVSRSPWRPDVTFSKLKAMWLWDLSVTCRLNCDFSPMLVKTSNIWCYYLRYSHLRDVFSSTLCVAPLQHLQFTVVSLCRHLQQHGQPLSQHKGKATPSDLIRNE